jgi:hypothetical protein
MVLIAMEWVAMMLTHESEKRKRCCAVSSIGVRQELGDCTMEKKK